MMDIIILKSGYERLTSSEYEKFDQGDSIWGNDRWPDELKRWKIEEEQEAKAELAKYRCSYEHATLWYISEYALEYCECDEDGEFVCGFGYDLAEDDEDYPFRKEDDDFEEDEDDWDE